MTEVIQPPPIPVRSPSQGQLALTSLGMGIASILFGVFIVGGIPGLAGVIMGLIALKKHAVHRTAARWGIALSLLGLTLASVALFVFLTVIRPAIGRSGFSSAQFNGSQWIGKPVPALSLTTVDGRVIRLADLKGRPVVLAMWASWHPACASAVADFNRLVKETSGLGVQVVAVSFEEGADVSAFIKDKTIAFPIVVTNDLPAPFGSIESIPTTFYINTNGIISDVKVGYDSYEAVKQSIFDKTSVAGERTEEK